MIEDISPDERTQIDGSDTDTHSFRYDPQEESLSVSITRAVAAASELDPLSLEPRLYDVVDPDALEALVASDPTDSDVRVSFPFGRHLVTVTGAGEITVRDETPTR